MLNTSILRTLPSVLFGVMVGGFATVLLFRNLILEAMTTTQAATPQIALYNILDHLIPYYGVFGGGAIVVGIFSGYIWTTSKK